MSYKDFQETLKHRYNVLFYVKTSQKPDNKSDERSFLIKKFSKIPYCQKKNPFYTS